MNPVEIWRRIKQERPVIRDIAAFLAKFNVHPNTVSLVGFLLSLIPPVLYATGHPVWGAIILILTNVFDSIDGTLARMTEKASRFGAFLDSSLDRFSEFALFLGFAYYFRDNFTNLLLIFLALFGSFMVSYTRARAEGLDEAVARGEDKRLRVGPMDRTFRILYIFLMSFFWNYFTVLMGLYVVLVYLTVFRRMYAFHKVASGKGG